MNDYIWAMVCCYVGLSTIITTMCLTSVIVGIIKDWWNK
jgi:hypothetical protein